MRFLSSGVFMRRISGKLLSTPVRKRMSRWHARHERSVQVVHINCVQSGTRNPGMAGKRYLNLDIILFLLKLVPFPTATAALCFHARISGETHLSLKPLLLPSLLQGAR